MQSPNKRAWRLCWFLQAVCLLGITLTVSARHSAAIRTMLQAVLPGTVFTYTIDTTTPLGSSAPSTIDDRIREAKAGWQERLNVDHFVPLTGSLVSDADAGYHRDIHFYSTTATDPVLDFTTVGGIDELRYTDSAGTSKTLTSNGTLNIVSADLLGTLANNTYFTAVDVAGTGTVNLIKANASNVAVIPDGSETATSAAPAADADISNKKYVDDQIDATVGTGTFSPTAYAGEESITFPNGFILKQGSVAGTASGSVTFAAAFPTGCTRVWLSFEDTVYEGDYAPKVLTKSVTGFTFASDVSVTVVWLAWGY